MERKHYRMFVLITSERIDEDGDNIKKEMNISIRTPRDMRHMLHQIEALDLFAKKVKKEAKKTRHLDVAICYEVQDISGNAVETWWYGYQDKETLVLHLVSKDDGSGCDEPLTLEGLANIGSFSENVLGI